MSLVQQVLDASLDIVGQLEPVGAEQFDAVVLEQVVRGRDHDAEIATHRTRQHRDGRSWDRSQNQHVHSDRGEAGDHRIFDHIAGKASVLSDHDAVAMLAALKHQPSGLAHLQRQFSRDLAVRAPANAIGAEILAPHRKILLAISIRRGRLNTAFYPATSSKFVAYRKRTRESDPRSISRFRISLREVHIFRGRRWRGLIALALSAVIWLSARPQMPSAPKCSSPIAKPSRRYRFTAVA